MSDRAKIEFSMLKTFAILTKPKYSANGKENVFAIARTLPFIVFCIFFLITIPRTSANNLDRDLLLTQSSESKSCTQDITELSSLLLEDIPDYSNRVIKRTQDIHQDAGIDTYIITAGVPETEPLNLPQIDYGLTSPETTEQIFFTTLERQYTNRQKIERQTFHWLFVTMTDSGWHLVTMYSRFGHATKNTPSTPPQESSNGIIGQAASLWLRDCRESLTLR